MKPFVILMVAIAIFCYGSSSVLAKAAYKRSAPTDSYALAYALFLLVFTCVGLATNWTKLSANYASTSATGFWFMTAAGLCAATGFVASANALADKSSYVSIVIMLIGAFPLVSSALSFMVFKEADQLHLWRYGAGASLMVAGGYLISTSTK